MNKYRKHFLSLLVFLNLSVIIEAQISINSISTTYSENFDGLGSTATATLPSGWKVGSGPIATSPYTSGLSATISAAGTAGVGILFGTSTGSCYNFANGVTATSTDRAVGFLNSGSYTSPRCLMVQLLNNTGITITDMSIIYDIEKYRSGSRAFTVNFYTSVDGITWVSTTTAGDQAYAGDAANTTVYNPPLAINKNFSLSGLSIANGANFYLRWQITGTGGSTNGQALGIDNFSLNCCPSNTYFYETVSSGNWSNPSTWEVSPTIGGPWSAACSPPSNTASGVTILNGHTVTVDVNSSSPDLTINNGGTLQANTTSSVNLTIIGNITNNGTLQMYDGVANGVYVIFNKNGNQNITGTGAITNFYSIGLNMGTSNGNLLDISSTNFSSYNPSLLLINSGGTSALQNGTIRFSGSYTYANSLFNIATPTIPSTAGIWINNPNVTITAKNYNLNNSGRIRVSAGTFNLGTNINNSIFLLNSSVMIIDGGTVNVAGRIQANNSAGVAQSTTYTQSGGVVNLMTVGSDDLNRSALEFDNNTDNFFMSGGTIVIRNQVSSPSTTVEVYNSANINFIGGTLQFGDALSTNITSLGFWVYSSSHLPSILIDNSASLATNLELNSNIVVDGSITINSGATLKNTLIKDISLKKDWTNNGTLVSSNNISFIGNTLQHMTGSTTTSFNNLIINNTSGGVVLQTPENVNGLLTLQSGLVNTSTNLLTMNAASSVTAASNTSFVNGPLAKVGSSAFVFPVGKDAEYRPIADSALSGSDVFTAEYFHANPSPIYDSSLHDATIDHLERCEYWILNRAGTANAYVKLSWDTYSCGVDQLSDLTVVRWDGSMWTDQGNGGTTGTTTSGTVISNGLVSSFSPFTLGSISPSTNPLPIELLNFSAKYNELKKVDLSWSTSSETNNDFFTIERSGDAVYFDELTKVKGAGNSNQILNYATKDNSPLPGTSYYRLKQTDYNGQYKYSSIIAVDLKSDSKFAILNTYSASSESGLEVTFSCNIDDKIVFELYNIIGEIVFSIQPQSNSLINKLVIPTNQFPNGIYLLTFSNGEKTITKKIVN
ncbi:MAG: T9SS type A sorting domain-containing protein [Bacteroidota bacterium]